METLESSNREHLHGIESIVYVEFAVISALILLGGLFFGVLSGRWDQAIHYGVVLLSAIAVSVILIYLTFRLFNKIERFLNKRNSGAKSSEGHILARPLTAHIDKEGVK
jgi:hypothetical protein